MIIDELRRLEEAIPEKRTPMRYKVQQDKGVYALKGCEDGDLVDYSEYARLERELAELQAPQEATGACNCGDRWVHATDCPAAPRREPEDRV